MKMNRYDEYKDSGIEWIGEIPKDWITKKLKYLGIVKGRIGFKGYAVSDLVDEAEIGCAIVLGGTNIMKDGTVSYEKLTYLSEFKYNESPEIMLKGGEILITKVGAGTGESAIYTYHTERVTINPNVMIFIPQSSADGIYINYSLSSEYIKSDIYIESNKSGAQPAINQEFVKNIRIVLPDDNVKEKICIFIAKRLHQIKTLISDKQRLIDLLKENRQAIISEAVTKGLDKNAKMKDSGIEWIGEIPEDWEIKKLSYITKAISGGTPSRDKIEYWDNGNIPWMSSGEINKVYIKDTYEYITYLGMENSNAKMLPKHTVMMALNGQGKTKGMSAILEIETTCNQSLVGFACNEQQIEYKFLFYIFQAMYKYIRSLVGDESREGLSVSFLKLQRVPVPCIKQQREIIDNAKNKLYTIDTLISDIETQIEKLKEYRQNIISEAVTGKIKVEISSTDSKSKNTEANTSFKRRVIAARILDELCSEPTMGHVKLEKILFLSEYCAELDLHSKYDRHAAGPYSPKELRSIDSQLKKAYWFKYDPKTPTSNKYERLGKSQDYKTYYDRYVSSEQQDIIDRLINFLRKDRTIRCEIIATLYGAWNDFLIDGINPSDDQIVDEVLYNWHESKEKISRERWMNDLQWMKANNIIPTGYGASTKKGNV